MRTGWLGFLSIAVLAITFANISQLSARDIHVDNVKGNDRNDGSSADPREFRHGPCKSILRALKHAQKGDRIVLANTGVPYQEAVVLQGARHSGTPEFPFEIVGNGAILDGTGPVENDDWKNVDGDLFCFQPDFLSHQQVYLNGRPAAEVKLEAKPSEDDLEPLQWALFRGKIYFRTEPKRLPLDYAITHTKLNVGIGLYAVRNVVISDLTVQGFTLDGINAADSVFDAQIEGVTCRGNGRSGLYVGGASRVLVNGCLVGNNGVAQLQAKGAAKVQLISCDLIDSDPDAPAMIKGEKATVSVD